MRVSISGSVLEQDVPSSFNAVLLCEDVQLPHGQVPITIQWASVPNSVEALLQLWVVSPPYQACSSKLLQTSSRHSKQRTTSVHWSTSGEDCLVPRKVQRSSTSCIGGRSRAGSERLLSHIDFVAHHVAQIPVAEVWAITTDPAVGYGFTWACTCCSPSFNEQVRRKLGNMSSDGISVEIMANADTG